MSLIVQIFTLNLIETLKQQVILQSAPKTPNYIFENTLFQNNPFIHKLDIQTNRNFRCFYGTINIPYIATLFIVWGHSPV